MSTYIEDSELSQFNVKDAGASQIISDDLARVISLALKISNESYVRLTSRLGRLLIYGVLALYGRVEKHLHKRKLLI